MSKAILAAFALVFFAGCKGTALRRIDSGNEHVAIELVGHIAEHGCDVYRIKDYYWSYATVCKGSSHVTTESVHSESCGDNCEQVVHVPNTVTAK